MLLSSCSNSGPRSGIVVLTAAVVAATPVPGYAPPIATPAPPAALASSSATETQELRDDPRVVQALELLEIWIDAAVAYEQIPGASAAVVHDQELLWSAGFGRADLEDGRPATPTTLYSICSISKLFTSVAVMQQWEQGRVELDDPVGRHLEWFDLENTFPDGLPVTVEGILTHSAGLPRESDHPYWSPDFDFPTRQQIIERLTEQRTLYPAERYFQYSNLGLTLVGEIVAAVSGTAYPAYVRAHVLEPLELDDTSPEIPIDEVGGRLARGYSAMTRQGRREPLPPFQAEGIAPAAGFASTVEDLGRFAAWQFRLLSEGGHEVLDAATLRKMHRVHWVDHDWDTHWGLGFSVWRDNDETYVGHGGSCPGYRSQLALQPDAKVAVAFAANALGVYPGKFTRNAHRIVGPALKAASDAPEEAEAHVREFEKYTGAYSSFPWSGEGRVLLWDDGLAIVGLPTDDPVESLVELRHVEDHTFRRVRDDGELGEEMVFQVDADGEVTGFVRHSNPSPKIR